MLNTQEVHDSVNAISSGRVDIYRKSSVDAARARFDAERFRLEQEWREWLEKQYAQDIPTGLLTNIYDRAWAEGHSSGYFDVQDRYEDLTDFVREVLAAK